MNPIFQDGRGNGIGYSVSTFHEKFDELCREHAQRKRAKAFAFIFYDHKDKKLQEILKNKGAFAKLDRLSGNQLSVFYLDPDYATKERTEYFNSHFLSKLGATIEATPPCVVFFKVKSGRIEDVATAQLDSPNLMHGLQELYVIIEDYIRAKSNQPSTKPSYLRWINGGAGFLGLEVFRAALRKALEHLP